MAVELVFAPDVQIDIEDAYAWYEERRPGLGEEFLSCVESCLHTICRSPDLYPKVYEEYRRALVRRFPYAVFYEFHDDKVVVYSVFHTSQNPKKWTSRLT
jgi:plasmid stabilization system protein ParE